MSSAIAEKLLSGWAMLAQTCPMEGCYAPLVRDLNGKIWCLECNMECIGEKEAERRGFSSCEQAFRELLSKEPHDLAEQLVGEEEWSPPTEDEMRAIDAKIAKRNDVSGKLGEKMLGGWALLGEECQNEECQEVGVPLLRSKQGEYLCVLCETSGQPKEIAEILEEMDTKKISQESISTLTKPVEIHVAHTQSIKRKLAECIEYLDSIPISAHTIGHVQETAHCIGVLHSLVENMDNVGHTH